MRFIYDDGGRAEAGFKGAAGDCVCRAVAIAADLPYAEVYRRLARMQGAQRVTRRSGKKAASARNGIDVRRKWFRDLMAEMGFVWTPTMGIGTGCTVHLAPNELPRGRLIVAVSRHYTAVIDGVVHDTYDPQRETWSHVGGDYHPDGWSKVKPSDRRTHGNINGGDAAWRLSRRCVYGYWKQKD